ncbi:chemotaxis protein CheW [Teredinibacter sp. KSP-S5-2]|uniref:chemotaxis protein CheW n=1 Tax=Teredinibacter sp. KSP-S5-2 TaxID=3034506 RepID=UPI002934EFCA|nr:chemotaxis protein CheW [Teredinibacter sp. KSP-S5-2]WNO09357.1 chemotaxis protein CheW [Teredinibacter sp. KSP-S5-2]
MSKDAAYQALASLAALSKQSAKGLPAQQKSAPRWSGVGFSFMGFKFVTPMGIVAELMELPQSTRLPGVQPWVIGLSNVRGRLLALFDLPQFLGGKLISQKKQRRVLVLETDTLYSGLVVDQAYGMQHFYIDSFRESVEGLPESIAPYVRGSYSNAQGEQWLVFRMETLAEDDRFTNAAAV